jgi:hypothetical protein
MTIGRFALDRVKGHNTSVVKVDNWTVIAYHNTPCVKFNKKKIVLNTCGWWTNTTKARMNQASNEFKLGFKVFVKTGIWFVEYKKQVDVFEEEVLELRR